MRLIASLWHSGFQGAIVQAKLAAALSGPQISAGIESNG